MNSELVPPGLVYLADNIVSYQNILGVSRIQSARWAQGLNLPRESDILFFAGCGYQFSAQLETLMGLIRQMDKSIIGAELPMRFARFQKKLGLNLPELYGKILTRVNETEVPALEAAIKVLHTFGKKPGYLAEEEPCCGAPLHHAGMQTKFARNARQAYDKIKMSGVKQLISVVPYCANALANLFPRFIDGYDLEVKHFVQVIDENLATFKPRFPRKVKVTYHDPCQLVRFLNIVDEPRRILRGIDGIELVEADWTYGEWSTCCGGGGGFEAVFPELSQVLAVNRTRELLETGAEIIVTHCPGCIMQLKSGLRQLKIEGVDVLDLSQVVAIALEK